MSKRTWKMCELVCLALLAQTAAASPPGYVLHTASTVVVSGVISNYDAEVGIATVNESSVYVGDLLPEIQGSLQQGDKVIFIGTQASGVELIWAISVDLQSDLTQQGFSGAAKQSITGTGKQSITGTGTSLHSITGTGIRAQSITGTGIRAQSITGTGIRAQSITGTGIRAQSITGTGVRAQSITGTGIRAQSITGTGRQSITGTGSR